MGLKEAIKAEAQRLGFTLAGVTTPDPPPHLAVFEAWLREGRQGEMDYLASERSRQRRADPRQILPACRSILALGVPYFAPGKAGNARQVGQIAAYAWGSDYHEVLPERLKALAAFIESQSGRPLPNRWYTDSGPVLERDLAQRAGLGWIGKNTCLIHPRLGSYFLLAEILLGLDLEPDPPFTEDRCGTCTRCLQACPTGCILPDRTLDARRCISYLTIELKGSIPPELRQKMGGWVFGCDICQQVCPWNERFAPPEGDVDFKPRLGVLEADLSQELSLTPEAFNHKFKLSPLKHAKRRGYLRNVGVALGNQQDSRSMQALVFSLQNDSEALVRAHVAWALGQFDTKPALQALEKAADLEKEAWVLAEILAARGVE